MPHTGLAHASHHFDTRVDPCGCTHLLNWLSVYRECFGKCFVFVWMWPRLYLPKAAAQTLNNVMLSLSKKNPTVYCSFLNFHGETLELIVLASAASTFVG